MVIFVFFAAVWILDTREGYFGQVYETKYRKYALQQNLQFFFAIITLFGLSNVTCERIFVRHWCDVKGSKRAPLYCLHGFFTLLALMLFPFAFLLPFLGEGFCCACFCNCYLSSVFTFVPLCIISLCEVIQTMYMEPIQNGKISICPTLETYAQVKTITKQVGKAFTSWLLGAVVFLCGYIFVSLVGYIRSDYDPLHLVNFIPYLASLLALISIVAYPSILVERADLRLREIVANWDFSREDQLENTRDNLLLSLYLDADVSGLTIFGTVITSDILTLTFRVFYAALAYVLTAGVL